MKKHIFTLTALLAVSLTLLHPRFLVSALSINETSSLVLTRQLLDQIAPSAEGQRSPLANLGASRELLTTYNGPRQSQLAIEDNLARPTALASGDFDEDGIADLLCAYAITTGGLLTLHRGNVRAIYPHSDEGKRRRANDVSNDSPFIGPALIFELPAAPDFLAAGDFDADGHWDVVTASSPSNSLYSLSGNGRGEFTAARMLGVPGSVKQLVSGEINRADGLADLAVAVVGPQGDEVLIFEGPEGALRSNPVTVHLQAPVAGLVLQELTNDSFVDLAIAAGELVIVAGREQEPSLMQGRESSSVVTIGDDQPLPFNVTSRADIRSMKALHRDGDPIAVLPMRLNADSIDDFVILSRNSSMPAVVLSTQMTFTVTNTNDTGSGSLRNAITLANSNPGPDLIDFNILPGGPQTITPLSALPTITGPVTIDGTTQPSFSGTPIVELNGSSLPPGTNGLLITAGTSTVRGLLINRIPGNSDAIEIQTNGGNIVEGNFLGTDFSGNVAQGNGNGVFINGSPNNTIGGTTPAARNLISANNGAGIRILGLSSTGNVVQGNFIGTNAAGTADLGNSANGVDVSQGVTTIGGTLPGARNIISGNNNNGILFGASSGNLIQGNFIGTDVNGTADLGNSQSGAQVTGGSANNSFGGTTPGARNIISGNGSNGIQIRELGTNGNLVQGNFIGTQVDGSRPLGNTSAGVLVENLASNNMIGGTVSGAGNVIAFNSNDGVTISSDTGNAIRANSIFSNEQLGIDLGPNGVTPNDGCDGDAGANNLQNFPVILGSSHSATTVIIQGTLNSTPNTIFSLDFFANTSCDTFGFGEGSNYLGTATVRTDPDCSASFTVIFDAVVATGQVVTATATDPAGNTSEFSFCGAPTAAPANISGQITSTNGRPVGGVIMTLNGGVQVRRAITDEEGNYSFINVETDHLYSVLPQRANYLFSPAERTFTLLANKADAEFTASPIFETANPLDTPEFFVRQNYLDFLGREPEQGGLDYWSGEIRSCNGDERCINARRIAVSAAFFIEAEFQESGRFVHSMYKGSLARHPRYVEFTADRRRMTQGGTLDERRAAFARDWVGRALFKDLYPDAMTTTEFVNRLFDMAALFPYTDERRQQIAAMRAGKTRAEVLLDLVEIGEFRRREFNPSFVLMEYFAYLRREPDTEGYEFWLDTLNNREPGNYRGMVCAFITSREYQQRFSSVVTRTNSDCGH
jgi:Domain of unknown function (DUF4214)